MSTTDATLALLVARLVDAVAEAVVARLVERDRPGGEAATSPWMNVTTAAAHLDWPRQRLYKLAAQGAVPHYKHEGRLLFNRHELDRWLAGFRRTTLEERLN